MELQVREAMAETAETEAQVVRALKHGRAASAAAEEMVDMAIIKAEMAVEEATAVAARQAETAETVEMDILAALAEMAAMVVMVMMTRVLAADAIMAETVAMAVAEVIVL